MFAPAGQGAEFFGPFAVVGRTSSFIGPAIFGWVAAEAVLWFAARGQADLAAGQSGQRLALITIGLFLLVGLLLLSRVDEGKGRTAAAQTSTQEITNPRIEKTA